MENKNTIFKTTMTWGLLLGIVLIIFNFIPYLKGLFQLPAWVSFLTYAIMIAGVALGQIKYRDNDLGGYISYGRCFGAGMLVMLFASIIYAFYFIILTNVIDPNYMSKLIEASSEIMYQSGMPEEQIEMAMEMSSKMMTPALTLFSSILGYAFFGAIFSLITSAFIKKEEPMFPSNNVE